MKKVKDNWFDFKATMSMSICYMAIANYYMGYDRWEHFIKKKHIKERRLENYRLELGYNLERVVEGSFI